ncbi:helix-turn-helix domain-containing protein [Ornithinibacillus sp. 179-J 7C1 HS]|uniref:helix-turn-helix domain-containing protein n=1 Tax=Ornithinibacillus sp. 179-J 7C1 HS TaxID=3142384 RepID=UPI0039A3661B
MEINEREYYKIKRQRLNLTLKEVAEFAKCDVSYLSKYERGKYQPSITIVERYKEYIDNH